ncbi:MAG: PQQ-binding-like beta-propeller repeat protein [Acidobacteria bacterium]|nr:PQQ-binding-like beta-propeller repeat protein [Acidobacteriota bacterium]MCW5970095.1 PQQ-binding-like beta-propeller repeat protein [Blastocatellales bacterium]
MSNTTTVSSSSQPSLRLWPGVVIVALQCLSWFVVPVIFPEFAFYGAIGGLVAGLVLAVWWLGFSKAPWIERIGVILLMVVAVFAAYRVVHPSIATGMMGLMLVIYSIPTLSLALVGGALAGSRFSPGIRRAVMTAAVVVACGVWTIVRTDGMTGEGTSQFAWRWSQTHEDRLLALGSEESALPVPTPDLPQPEATVEPNPEQPEVKSDDKAEEPAPSPDAVSPVAAWPGFRGPGRDGTVRGTRISTDWTTKPPVEVWRRPVGPGWSSFAVRGNHLYTQEQRGEDEIVACYELGAGKLVWSHRDAARFWESNAGAGPRGTPTLSGGRVYTLGATGIVNALDAGNGAVIWSRNASTDTGAKLPGWGFAGSPLVVNDIVVVAASGRLIAYESATGAPRWTGPADKGGYSSPHLAMIGGVAQILLLNGAGAISVSPADGSLLWEHQWPGDGIVQPAVTTNGDILIGTGSGMGASGIVGLRRVSVTKGAGDWVVEERWTSIGLKPYYNDFVIHNGHAFGFDGSILACVDLADGKRKWKGGRYGHGQLLALKDQNLLLVLSEDGEVVLVSAGTERFAEVARFRALEGKTWNHPVLVGDLLLARNGEEMAAFRLPLAEANNASNAKGSTSR